MNAAVFRRMLLYTCALPIFGAAVVVSIHAWLIVRQPPVFRAAGRVIVQPPQPEDEAAGFSRPASAMVSFYGTQIEILESGHLQGRALDRMRGMYPEMEPCEVVVRATQTTGSSILNVVTEGSQRKFTHSVLDALLDEFVAYHKEIQNATVEADSAKLIAGMSEREQRLKESQMKYDEAFRNSQDGELLAAERSRLAQLVSQLRGELESLKGSSNSTEAIEMRLKDAEAKLQAVIGKAATASEHSLALESLKLAYQNALREQDEAKAKLQSLAQKGKIERVSILERPADAVEYEPEVFLPLAVSGALGFVGGLLLMFLISLGVALRSRPAAPPPPLD